MTKTLLDGPGRVLESVYPRFLVDLAQGDDARLPQAHQQQFRERLMQELLSRVQLQTWTNGGMLNAPLSLRLTLVEKLASMLDPGHLALTQIAQHLALLQKMDHRQHSAFPELPQQIAALYEWFSARCRWKEKALTQRGLLVQAGDQSEQIFTRWRAGAYNAWSLPGRCFIVLEELRWGAFGDACRLGSPQAVALLLGDLLEKATQHLAESINAAPTTRHYYHQWFASSTVPTGGEHADFLSWLGKWTTADKQPVCWSVTQRWQTVALGMPRLCSAQHLALLQKMDHRQHSAFPELPQQIAALYEWFSARCRWKEKALTQRGLLVQAGDQSEQIFTRWRAGAYNAWSLPGRCFIVLEELRWGAFGDACRLGSPQAVALLLGDLLEKATQHLAESINAAPTTRHYYHQWFASSTVPTGGEHADFLSWLGKWTTADKQPVCWSVTQRWQTVALGMPRLCSAQRLAGAMLEEIFSVNLA